MTSKERMLLAMLNLQPDHVPCSPDISNMIPCKLTGKPFWATYLYQDPPLWKAYIDAVRYFGIDGWFGCIPSVFVDDQWNHYPDYDDRRNTVIIYKNEERIITREYNEKDDKKEWSPFVSVFRRSDPPARIKASTVGLEDAPKVYWPIEGVKPQKKDGDAIKEVKDYMGNNGVVGVTVSPPFLYKPDEPGFYSVYDYHDRHEEVMQWSEIAGDKTIHRLEKILSLPIRPDFIITGASGLLVWSTPEMLREISLPTMKRITELCKDAVIPSQVHCCGPSKEVVKMCAEETNLNSINPLEISPMGDCNLRNIKKEFGHKLSLMGNLHTTDVMLRGTVNDVEIAAKKAIDDAAKDGGFILSTGDQCGRDTPDENVLKMVEVAKTYGQY
jgi:uroporphyrinogen decarboxylase